MSDFKKKDCQISIKKKKTLIRRYLWGTSKTQRDRKVKSRTTHVASCACELQSRGGEHCRRRDHITGADAPSTRTETVSPVTCPPNAWSASGRCLEILTDPPVTDRTTDLRNQQGCGSRHTFLERAGESTVESFRPNGLYNYSTLSWYKPATGDRDTKGYGWDPTALYLQKQVASQNCPTGCGLPAW